MAAPDQMITRLRAALCLSLALLVGACDRLPLFAPSESSIALTAAARILALGTSAEITAVVLEKGGQPVQNGTTVRFTTSLGRVDPVEVQTRNGIAVTTFFAGDTSGVADVRASSGAAGSGTAAEGAAATNLITFTLGAAATDSISIRANPSSVPATGGTVEVVAVVLATNGRPVSGIPVAFTASAGTLSAVSATTDGNGEAAVRLTTSVASTVTATAGGKTTTTGAAISVLGTPAVTLQCQGSGTAGTACTQTVGSIVTFTASRGANTTTLVSATLDFGDGNSTSLGSLASPSTVSRTYNSANPHTATLTATDVNGQTTSASVVLNITPRAAVTPLGVTVTGEFRSSSTVAAPSFPTGAQNSAIWRFTAAVSGATGDAALVESYTWDFGDDSGTFVTSGNTTEHVYTGGVSKNGAKNITVGVRTTDGRSATGRTQILLTQLTTVP